jgi:transposase
MIAGETDLEELAKLRRGRVKATREELIEAVRGRLRDHHRFLLRLHLTQIDALHASIRELEARAGELLEPFRPYVDHLTTMPGVSETTARVLIAEIGLDMSRFPTAGHLLSWAGLCPRSDESAGKRRSTRVRMGDRWLKTALVQAAWAASRKKDSYLRAQYLRLKTRRGGKKAVVAVAATMLTSAYFMLLRGVPYAELGPLHFDRTARKRVANRLVQRLRDLGLQVEVKEAA